MTTVVDDTDAAYRAQSLVMVEHGFGDPVDEEEVGAWVADVMCAAGFKRTAPSIRYDEDDEDESVFGRFTMADKVVHVRAEHAFPLCVLHEVAHAVEPDDDHGPRWQTAFYKLTRAALGAHVADRLIEAIHEENLAAI